MKKLMNEVLPAPVVAPKNSPRDRVLRHMRDALAAGASVALLTGCPFAVVDPLPQAALCRSQSVELLVTAVVTKVDTDGGAPQYLITLTYKSGGGVVVATTPPTVMNGTLVSFTDTEVRVTAAAGAASFDVVIAASCEDFRTSPRKLGIRLIVDTAKLTVGVAEVPAP